MKRILLVDDSKLQRIANMRILTKAGYDVSLAADGEEAIALVSQQRPDLIVLDLLLPRMSGVDLLRVLKQAADTASIPVVVLSGLSEKNGAKLLKEGAAAYFEKSKLEGHRYADAFLELARSVLGETVVHGN